MVLLSPNMDISRILVVYFQQKKFCLVNKLSSTCDVESQAKIEEKNPAHLETGRLSFIVLGVLVGVPVSHEDTSKS